MRIFSILLLLIFSVSCRGLPDTFGFYQPITMDMTVPDGPPEFKAGWYAGCRTGLGLTKFANAWVYQEDEGTNFGNGIYQHDPMFQTGWSQAWFACAVGPGTFAAFHSMKNAPLSK